MNRHILGPFITGLVVGIALSTCDGCVHGPVVHATDRLPIAMLTIDDHGSCTAFKVGEHRLATAGHCCMPDATYTLDDGSHPTVLHDDDVHDVCILEGDIPGRPLDIRLDPPDTGEVVWTRGYPSGVLLISDGYWSGTMPGGQGVCSVVVSGGASGSPVMDVHDRVVGILVKGDIGIGGSHNMTVVTLARWLNVALLSVD